MSAGDLTLAMRLLLDSQQFVRGLVSTRGAIGKFTSGVKAEIGSLRNTYGTVQGKLAALGVTVGATAAIIQSARIDRSLIAIGFVADASAKQIAGLRKELFAMSKQTGTPFQDLEEGFNTLVQAGLSWQQSLATIKATNIATAVTHVPAATLSGALVTGSNAFNFDLAKPGMALNLLDKMTVAGQLGQAELNALSDAFAHVGVNAHMAGFSFEKTLGLLESLSYVEPQPERLGTLTDNLVGLFLNNRYRRRAEMVSGVRFFDKQGASRDPVAVLQDLKDKYQSLKTDRQQQNFIGSIFPSAHGEIVKSVRTMLGGNFLSNVTKFTDKIQDAGGTLVKQLPESINNSTDQVGRLKASLQEAADAFARPINAVIDKSIQKLLNNKENGGLGLSGNQLFGLGAAGLAGGYLLSRIAGPIGKLFGLGTGVATGKALEQVGVTPVYVTNFAQIGGGPGSGIADIASGVAAGGIAAKVFGGWRAGAALLAASRISSIASFGAAGVAGAASMVGGAGAAGYGVGSLISKGIEETRFADRLGEGIARALAFFGNDNARDSVAARDKYEASLKIEVSDTRTKVSQLKSNHENMQMDVTDINHLGQMGTFP